jgi:hypothetical protein
MYADASDGAALEAKLRAAAAATTNLLSTLLFSIPMMGCAKQDTLENMMTPQQEQAMCKLLHQGSGSEQPCCVDLSDASVSPYATALRSGVNYWSDNSAHTDAQYATAFTVCQNALNGTTGADYIKKVIECRGNITGLWVSQGARVARGTGKSEAADIVKALRMPATLENMMLKIYNTSAPSYRCIKPAYTPDLETKLSGTCYNLEEALAIIGKYSGMARPVYANPEPNKEIPEVRMYVCACVCLQSNRYLDSAACVCMSRPVSADAGLDKNILEVCMPACRVSYVPACMCVHMYTHKYSYTYYILVCIYAYVRTHMYTLRTHIDTYTLQSAAGLFAVLLEHHIQKNIRVYIHTYTYTQILVQCTSNGNCEFMGVKDGPLGVSSAVSGGRWAQVCEFYTDTLLADVKEISDVQESSDTTSNDKAQKISEYISKVPCVCSWLVTAKQVLIASSLPTNAFLLNLPSAYNCPAKAGSKDAYTCMPLRNRCVHLCTCVYVCLCVHIYIYIYIYIYTYYGCAHVVYAVCMIAMPRQEARMLTLRNRYAHLCACMCVYVCIIQVVLRGYMIALHAHTHIHTHIRTCAHNMYCPF